MTEDCSIKRTVTARWRPAVLARADVVLSVWAMIVMAIGRSWDYGSGKERYSVSPGLAWVEAAAPVWAWAAAFGVGGALLLLGVITRKHFLVWCGHASLAVLYTALCFGLTLGTLSNPFFDGIRSGLVLLLPTIFHWTYALRMGPRPLDPDEAWAEAVILHAEGGGHAE